MLTTRPANAGDVNFLVWIDIKDEGVSSSYMASDGRRRPDRGRDRRMAGSLAKPRPGRVRRRTTARRLLAVGLL
jgi:hypothetical protein